MSDDLLTIGEMCAEFGVTPRTLRFYEAKELISPVREGQKRLYTRRQCAPRLKPLHDHQPNDDLRRVDAVSNFQSRLLLQILHDALRYASPVQFQRVLT